MHPLWITLLFITGAVVMSYILYLIIKAAVRDGIIEATGTSDDDSPQDTISKIKCPTCGKEHEMDYPKCPFCGHIHFE